MIDVFAREQQFAYSIDGPVNVRFKEGGSVVICVPREWVAGLRQVVRQEKAGLRISGTGLTTEALGRFRWVRKPAVSDIALNREAYRISVSTYRPMKKFSF